MVEIEVELHFYKSLKNNLIAFKSPQHFSFYILPLSIKPYTVAYVWGYLDIGMTQTMQRFGSVQRVRI